MRKYTILVAAAALLLAFDGAGLGKTAPKAPAKAPAAAAVPAVPAPQCTNPDAFAAEPPVTPFTSLTGGALHQYIDAFNSVTGGQQGYDDFDRLDVYHPRPGTSVSRSSHPPGTWAGRSSGRRSRATSWRCRT